MLDELPYFCSSPAELPDEVGWLQRQPCPVVAVGECQTDNADVVLSDPAEVDLVTAAIERNPLAALALVQVLRAVDHLDVQAAMTLESLAYATLQAGAEYQAWLQARDIAPQLVYGGTGEPVVIERRGNVLTAELNRPDTRNSLTVEMRDALVDLFELVLADDSIQRLELSGRGACFSVGGELREFGLTPDPATAHWVRSMHNPGRLLARCADRVHVHVHSACLGSGIEIPAFARHVSAAPRSFFQLPELSLGLIPGAGGCVSICRRIGRQRTAWMVLSGKKVPARQALEWGLIDEIRIAESGSDGG